MSIKLNITAGTETGIASRRSINNSRQTSYPWHIP